MNTYFFQSASTVACQLTQQVRWAQYQNSLQQSGNLYEDTTEVNVTKIELVRTTLTESKWNPEETSPISNKVPIIF